jgi:tetratricopeptide (TPR) repeat protein
MSRHQVHDLQLSDNEETTAVLFRLDSPIDEEGGGEMVCFRPWKRERGRPRKERGPRVMTKESENAVPILSIEISEVGRRIAIRAISRSYDLDLTSLEMDAIDDRLMWMRIILAEIARESRCRVVDHDGTPAVPLVDAEAEDLDDEMTPDERELFSIMEEVMESDDPPAQMPAALPKLEDLVARKPRFMAARAALGSALSELRRYDEAVPHLEAAARATTAEDRDSQLFGVLVEALYRLGRHEESLPWHRKRLELYPSDRPAIKDYFLTLMELDRDQEILKECDRLELPELQDVFFIARGEALQRLGRLDDALGWLRKYEKEHPRDPEIHVRLAQLYLVRGDTAKFRKTCERTESLLPKGDSLALVPILSVLGALWKSTGDEVGMRRIAKRLRRIDPEIAEALLR